MTETEKRDHRVSKEYSDLKEKVDRLHKFVMKSEDFKKLTSYHQLLLKKQLYHMIKMLEILDLRIKDLEQQVNKEKELEEKQQEEEVSR